MSSGKKSQDTSTKMAANPRRVVMGTRRIRVPEKVSRESPTEVGHNVDELREVNAKLHVSLEMSQNQIKQLRREKAVELREATEREQHKSNIMLKEVRLKMMQEKTADLEKQKDFLNKRYEADIAKMMRKRDIEMNKLQDALAKSQSEISRSKATNNGLSAGKARANSFEGEKAKLNNEVQELRTTKKKLELALKDIDRQHKSDLDKATQGHVAEINKLKRESESELRKLVDDVKCRDRQLAALERDMTSQVNESQRLRKEKEHITCSLHDAEENIKKMARRLSLTSSTLGDGTSSPDNPPGENGFDRSDAVIRRQLSDVLIQLKKFEDQCASLKQEKADLVRKVAEVEKRQRPLTDKARRFLEKNIELTSINRSLEGRIKTLQDENIELKNLSEKEKEASTQLNSQLEERQCDQDVILNQQMEIENLQQQIIEQDKTVNALKLACSEKDRRIELLCHRRRKQRAVKAHQKTVRFLLVPNGTVMAAGIKETYYGFDEDRSSVESELSTSSRLSSSRLSLDNTFDDDDMFDEYTREEFHRNYQRLAKEHLELEKSFALLQNQGAHSHVDPQRELKDVSWLDEKEKLNHNINSLKEKISEQEGSIQDLKLSLQEWQEQNEELEFRCLELEENNKKLNDDAQSSIVYKGPVTLTQGGVLELYAEGEGLIGVKIEAIKNSFLQYTESMDGHFSKEEKVVFLQTYALLNVAEQKLKEQQVVERELKDKLQHLEAEKDLEAEKSDADAAGITKELGDKLKDTEAKLEAAEILIQKLGEEVDKLRRQDAIHKYTEDFNNKAEERYKEEVTSLRRQLNTSQEGRLYESELLQAKLHELKTLEQRVLQLEEEKKDFEANLKESEAQTRDLQERIASDQETQALTESDKDATTLLHNLRTKLSQQEKSEQELSEKNAKLQTEVSTLRSRLVEYENIEAELTEKTFTLQQDADTYKRKHRSLEDELTATRNELSSLQVQMSHESPRVRDMDSVSMASMGSVSDLSEDNQSMRMELFSLREQIKMLEQENERYMRNAGGADVQHRMKALEKEIMDLKHENVTLKDRLKEKMKELDTVEEELGAQIRNKKAKINALEEEMEQSRNDACSMESMIVEMKKEMFASQEKLDILEDGDKERKLLMLTAKVGELEEKEEGLKEELEIMTASHVVLKGNAESLLRREEEYDAQISELHAELKQKNNLIADLELALETIAEEKAELGAKLHSSSQSSTSTVDNKEVEAMEDKVKTLEKDLHDAQDQERQAKAKLEAALTEKDSRITFLQEQLDRMELSEGRLNESLTDVEVLEGQLRRQQLELKGTGSSTMTSTASELSYDMELTQLRSTQEQLLSRIDELTETENSLRMEVEREKKNNNDDVKTGRADDSNDAFNQYKKRCHELEARVKELSGHESDLMEQIYAMQLENQELQEHIDLLQEASDHEPDEDEDAHVTKTERKTVASSSSTISAPKASDGEEVKSENKSAMTRLALIEAENEDLKQQLLESKLQAMATTKVEIDPASIVDGARVASLEAQVKDLLKHEEELVAEVESMHAAEKKFAQMQDHVHELEVEIEEHATAEKSLKDKVQLLEQSEEKLMEELDIICTNEGKLKEEVHTLKLASSNGQQELLDKIRHLERKEKDLKEEVEELEGRRMSLKDKLDEVRNSEQSEVKRLQEKVDILLDTEEKLIDRLQEQDTVEQQLRQKLSASENEVGEMNITIESSEGIIAELRSEIGNLTECEHESIVLKEQLQKANSHGKEREQNITEKDKMVAELVDSLGAKEKFIAQEKDKVSILEQEIAKLITKLKSTEKEVDTLNEKLSVSEIELKKASDDLSKMKEVETARNYLEKEKNELKNEVDKLSNKINELEDQLKNNHKEKEQLFEKVAKIQILESALSDAKSERHDLVVKNEIFINNEKVLKERINELEKSEAVLHTQVASLESMIAELRNTGDSLRQQLADVTHTEGALTARIVHLEKEEVRLETHITDLEVQNSNLMSNIRQSPVTIVKEVPVEAAPHAPSPSRLTPQLRSRSPSPRPWDDLSDLQKLEAMSREELISKVHELQTMESFHRKRLRELSNNLSQFRQAVETVTVSMETDTDVPVVSHKSKFKDSEYEAKVAEMARIEVNLKMKVMHLQSELNSLRVELTAAEDQIHEMEQNFRTEMEELEEELDDARKAEAIMKNKIQYSQLGQENQAIAKIQHLETLVFDLEAAERKLQRRVNDLETSEDKLKEKLIVSEGKAKKALEIPVKADDKHFDIIQQVIKMESSGKELTEKLTSLNREDTRELKNRIMELERSEKGLKRQLDLMEVSQEVARVSFTEEEALESPEAILKRRITELEKMEEHNKKQLVELERDREELSEITRHDKNTIHELNINLKELELLQYNLKEQISRHETQEGHYALTIDDLTERLEDAQNKVQKLEASAKQLKQSIGEHRSSKEDIALELQNITDDWKQDEQKFKKKVNDLESDKRSMADKIDELADRVGDLEGVEITLKSRLKVLENSEMELKQKVLELELYEGESKSRTLELESVNETLSQKLHDMEEEKTNIMYEMTELHTTRDSFATEVEHLKSSTEHLKARVMEHEGAETSLLARIEESAEHEASMMAKVAEYEQREQDLMDKISAMEENESKLRLTVQTLESSVSMANSRVQSSQQVDKENTSLHEELHLMRNANAKLTERKRQLEETVDLYEHAHADKSIATLPHTELSQLRMQVQLLAETETANSQLERSERNLKETISKLREGKDVCGHEAEIKELKDELNRLQTVAKERDGLKKALTSTKKAHELLKENHEAVKQELGQLKTGTHTVKSADTSSTSTSRATQARLHQSYKLTEVSPELRNALKGLGAKYPDAYQDFVRTLQPSQVAMEAKRRRQQHDVDAMVVPTNVAMVASQPQDKRDAAGRYGAVGLPVTSEDPLWETIEKHGSVSLNSGNEKEESFWANIENTKGELDDMTLCVTFADDLMSHSTSSIQSDVSDRSMPPLPTSLPPPPPPQRMAPPRDTFYNQDDSADEASEIVDEDDVVGVMISRRGKSVERDSDFSEMLPLGSSPQYRKNRLGQNTSSLDSIPDSGMGTLRQSDTDFFRERIVTVEKLLKEKEKELELARINQRDLERKVRDAEEAALLRTKPNSTDAESTESYLKNQIEQLDQEINTKSDEIDRLSEQLHKSQKDTRVAKDEYNGVLNEISALKADLNQKTVLVERYAQLEDDHAALKQEHDEMMTRYTQIAQAGEEKSALEKIILKLRGQLKDLERIDLERQDLEKRSKQMETDLKVTQANESEMAKEVVTLQRQRDELKQEVEHMTSTHAQYSEVITRYENMEQVKNKSELMVTPLRAKVIRLSQKCKERDNLIGRLAQELSRSGEPSDLLSEADRVKTVAASEEYSRPITPLQSQNFENEEAVIKTDQSGTFSQPRHRTTSGGSSAGSSSADSLLDDDTDRYFDKKKRSTSGHRGKADGNVKSTHSDLHLKNGGSGFTIDDIVSPSGISLQPMTSLDVGRGPETYTWPRKKMQTTIVHRAVKDYDPELFSQSGRKDQEVPLKEGQEVRILGGIDSHGYYEAEVEGRIGLVPANYLQPVNTNRPSKKHSKPVARHSSRTSPDQILAFHEQLQRTHIPRQTVGPSRSNLSRVNTIVHPAFIRRPAPPPGGRSTTMPRPRQARHTAALQRQAAALATSNQLSLPGSLRSSTQSLPDNQRGSNQMINDLQSPPPVDTKQIINMATVQAPPDPPSDFKIDRVVGEDAVLLSWQPPTLDELARSNGTTVTGYMIYINNRDKQKIPSPHMPKALIERLNLRRPNRFSIQSIGSNSQRSRVVDVLFEDVLPELAGDGLTSDDNNSSVQSSAGHHNDGDRRVFMAVYDYNPATHSPHTDPSDELSLRAGDLVTVHSGVNAEGFYHGTMNGKRGLVPASFVEEVSILRSHSRRSLSGSSQSSHPNSRSNSRHGSRPSSIHGNIPQLAAAPV